MLTVCPPEKASALLAHTFGARRTAAETVALPDALSRILSDDLTAPFSVPGFDRSAVDGFAVRAADTFGCTEALPALLTLVGEVRMGERPERALQSGECMAVPTGGALPSGADAMVMLEYTETLGALVAVQKPVAPGASVIFAADDVQAGQTVLTAGTVLRSAEIGVLASFGLQQIRVFRRPRVAILSTGDELLSPGMPQRPGAVYDVNGPLLAAQVQEAGGAATFLGVLPDDEACIQAAVSEAAAAFDLVLLSGGSSVGRKDAAERILEALGTVLLHGLALKPGKPTIFAEVGGVPVFGLPGHPVAAQTVFRLFGRPLLYALCGAACPDHAVSARLAEAVSSNHGREECLPVRLLSGEAIPVRSKSGLISALCGADGFVRISRDTEGLPKGAPVTVCLY